MNTYKRNKEAAKYRSKKPTMTDQSAAKSTDINIIVGQYLTTGQAPGSATPPRIGDFSQLPEDLRGMIDASRSISKLRASLPQQLAEKPINELLSLTAEQIKTILTPPAPLPAPKEKPE